jgi:hypothetical protein
MRADVNQDDQRDCGDRARHDCATLVPLSDLGNRVKPKKQAIHAEYTDRNPGHPNEERCDDGDNERREVYDQPVQNVAGKAALLCIIHEESACRPAQNCELAFQTIR